MPGPDSTARSLTSCRVQTSASWRAQLAETRARQATGAADGHPRPVRAAYRSLVADTGSRLLYLIRGGPQGGRTLGERTSSHQLPASDVRLEHRQRALTPFTTIRQLETLQPRSSPRSRAPTAGIVCPAQSKGPLGGWIVCCECLASQTRPASEGSRKPAIRGSQQNPSSRRRVSQQRGTPVYVCNEVLGAAWRWRCGSRLRHARGQLSPDDGTRPGSEPQPEPEGRCGGNCWPLLATWCLHLLAARNLPLCGRFASCAAVLTRKRALAQP